MNQQEERFQLLRSRLEEERGLPSPRDDDKVAEAVGRNRWATKAQSAIDASIDQDDPQTELVDILCNLKHWAEAVGADFDEAAERAHIHYVEESQSGDPRRTAVIERGE